MASSRRLAAIMFTDMVGFTRGTQLDERSSLTRLAEQEELVRPLIATHHGRVVKSTGDGLLAEFPSALKATECAVSIQERLRERNRGVGDAPIELRIGIHLGDVEERGEDIFGDAVNLAARVQPSADSGGIAVSQQVYDQVGNKLALRFEPLPPQVLKGVQTPMTIFRVVLPWNRSTSADAAAHDGSGRLAVLPFANISPDPKDAYFSDGLTEEVIAVLSELHELRVIARTSVEPYRTAPRPVSQIAQELGVRWVLEGSVRKSGSRLRFTVQLVDGRTQEPIWADKFDRELVDLFDLQSELARKVADALKLTLLSTETERLERRRLPRPESYLRYLQGRTHLRNVTEGSLRAAQADFEAAIELDPRNAPAYAGLAEAIDFLSGVYRAMPRSEALRERRRLVEKALELDPELAEALTVLGGLYADQYEYSRGLDAMRRAIALTPSFAGAHLYYAIALADVGRPEEALREFEMTEELDPLSGVALAEHVSLLTSLGRNDEARARLVRLGEVEDRGFLYHDRLGRLALTTDDLDAYRSTIEWFESRYPGRPELPIAWAMLAAHSGRADEARTLLARAEELPEGERPTSALAPVFAALGDLDRCFVWIDRAISEGRFVPRGWLYAPQGAAVRGDPRFAEILRRLGIA